MSEYENELRLIEGSTENIAAQIVTPRQENCQVRLFSTYVLLFYIIALTQFASKAH